ncbi:type I-B CRISPR-associated endonuclease Cas1b [Thermoanaerobacter sp. A7A]|uniref:type I-B CRISPR-associated endonuclease Cas1b n=1 Tax=Thermoanaerobacter sp. A7A TaxID=1350366 RepID=UPI0004222FF8|nr:type I-B CRISPR-associated endonuclease Cas1b [Thermoanaerobacter sp. A7A]
MKRSIYINTNGRLSRKDNTIYLESETYGKKPIPVNNIQEIFLFGEVDLNTKAINFLAQNNITLHVFNYYGYYMGSFYPREHLPSGFLLVKQVEKYKEEHKRLKIAKEIINGASHNILKNVKYYANRKEGLDEYVERIENERKNIKDAKTISELMGVEGRIRNIYYSAFETIIEGKFEFKNRTMNPPDNPINALISFGNSMMYSIVLTEIYNTQLNPTISYLHEPGERRFSLSLDISEIFKPIIVDRVIFSLINQKMIREEHFDQELEMCYLNEQGRVLFQREFEEKLGTIIKHPKLNRSVSYRRLIRLECYKLIKHLLDEEEYESLKMWW